MKKISVVMASLNEEKAIGKMIKSIRKNKCFEIEIIVVDSSTDNTAKIATELGAKVIHQKKLGHGIALRTAIDKAKNDIIITTDCDNTYPMEFIPKLAKLSEKYDLVSCNRLNKRLGENMPFINKLANKAFAFLVRLFYNINTHDVSTGMFCMRKKVNQKIRWEFNHAFPCEVIIRTNLAGFKYKEIDIPYRVRLGDITLEKWRGGKAYMKCIFKYKFKRCSGLNPV